MIGTRVTLATVWTGLIGCFPLASSVVRAGTPATWEQAISGEWADGANWSTAPEFPNNESPLAPTSVVHGEGGFSDWAPVPKKSTLGNQGRISADVPAGELSLLWNEIINDGVMEAAGSGATLTLEDRWDSAVVVENRGLLRAASGGVIEPPPTPSQG